MIRKVLFLTVFGSLYTVGTAWVSVWAMSAALSGFEPGEPRASAATSLLFDVLTQTLMFPFIPLFAPHGAPGEWGYLLIFGNGVLWGIALIALWSAVARCRISRRTGFLNGQGHR